MNFNRIVFLLHDELSLTHNRKKNNIKGVLPMNKESKNTFYFKCLIAMITGCYILSIVSFIRLDNKLKMVKDNCQIEVTTENTTIEPEEISEISEEPEENLTTQDLKPCPFCGSRAKICCSQYETATAWVECEHCEAAGSRYNNRENDLEDAKEHAIMLWNNRVQK